MVKKESRPAIYTTANKKKNHLFSRNLFQRILDQFDTTETINLRIHICSYDYTFYCYYCYITLLSSAVMLQNYLVYRALEAICTYRTKSLLKLGLVRESPSVLITAVHTRVRAVSIRQINVYVLTCGCV